MTMGQLSFDFVEDLTPIPDCTFLMEMTGYKTPRKVADEMVSKARLWVKNNPGKDVRSILTPEWVDYVIEQL